MNTLHRDVAWKLSDHGLIDLGGDGLNPIPRSLSTAERIAEAVETALDRGNDEVAVAAAVIAFEQFTGTLFPPTGTTDHEAPSDIADIVIAHRAPRGAS